MRRGRGSILRLLSLAAVLAAAGCPRRPPPPEARPAKPTEPAPVESAVSDVATGGSWQDGAESGVYRVVVRSGGRRNLRSDVVVQWLRWDQHAEQPIETKSVRVTELGRGGIIVTASRIDEEDGRTVIKLPIANAVTGAPGEARIWPVGIGRYRVKIKWATDRAD